MQRFGLAVVVLALTGCGDAQRRAPQQPGTSGGVAKVVEDAGRDKKPSEEDDSGADARVPDEPPANSEPPSQTVVGESGKSKRGTAGELPTGQQSPEGVACDAIMAYAKSDPAAWLATVVRPIYGEKGDEQFAEFKEQMAAKMVTNKDDESFIAPRIIKCFNARDFSRNGPGSAAFAIFDFTKQVCGRFRGNDPRSKESAALPRPSG